MLEIEMKFPVADFVQVKQVLAGWQARPDDEITEEDHYFNAPHRDFAQTDEALRIRRTGPHSRITYKGPKHAGPTRTRTELEVSLQDGDQPAETFARLLVEMGFRPTALVRKRRLSYPFQRGGFTLHACLDEVETLGSFVEVEIVAPPEQKEQARKVLLEAVAELGLAGEERRSYLEMVLEKAKI